VQAATPAVTTEEQVRSRHMKLFLQCVEAQEPAARDVLLAALPRADLGLVRESAPIAWLPVAVNARATEVVWSALDPKAREAFFLRLGAMLLDSSLLNVLVSTAVRLFGVEPGRILRWTPRAWTQVYRDTTRITVFDIHEYSLRIRFEGLPRVCVRASGWMESVALSTSALFSVTGRTGACALEDANVGGRSMVQRCRWQALAKPR
jgi:hypothetical protein